jgi:hypothetical protein
VRHCRKDAAPLFIAKEIEPLKSRDDRSRWHVVCAKHHPIDDALVNDKLRGPEAPLSTRASHASW